MVKFVTDAKIEETPRIQIKLTETGDGVNLEWIDDEGFAWIIATLDNDSGKLTLCCGNPAHKGLAFDKHGRIITVKD